MSTTQTAVTAAPPLPPLLSFNDACDQVTSYLKRLVPMGLWSVTQIKDGYQVYLHVRDEVYGKTAGFAVPLEDTFCQHVLAGVGPQLAPDAMAVKLYADAGVSRQLTIGSYIGVPIQSPKVGSSARCARSTPASARTICCCTRPACDCWPTC